MKFRLYLVKIEHKILKLVLVLVNNAHFKSTLCIIILSSNGLALIYFKTHVSDNVLYIYIWLFMDINFLIRY